MIIRKMENKGSAQGDLVVSIEPGASNAQTTELVFILDRSGSMFGLETDTIGGFNSMIAEQKKQSGKGFVTTVLFDDAIEVLAEREPLECVGEMTCDQYWTRGCTALLDAVGDTIKRVSRAQEACLSGCPDRTIFVITTDGMENASQHYTLDQVRKAIEKCQRENGWEFVFLGANIDAIETAGNLGIAPQCAADYHATSVGTQDMYAAVNAAVCSLRQGEQLTDSWKRDLV